MQSPDRGLCRDNIIEAEVFVLVEVLGGDARTDLLSSRDPGRECLWVDTGNLSEFVEQRGTVPLGEAFTLRVGSKQFAKAVEIESVFVGRVAEGVSDMACVGLGIEQIGDGALDRHGGQALDDGDVARVELALTVVDLLALTLSTGGTDKLVSTILKVTEFMEACCGGPGEDDAVLPIPKSLVRQAPGFGAEPRRAQVVERAAWGAGVLVDAVREPLQVARISQPGKIQTSDSARASLSRRDHAPLVGSQFGQRAQSFSGLHTLRVSK